MRSLPVGSEGSEALCGRRRRALAPSERPCLRHLERRPGAAADPFRWVKKIAFASCALAAAAALRKRTGARCCALRKRPVCDCGCGSLQSPTGACGALWKSAGAC